MLDLKDGAKFGNAVLAPSFLGNLDAVFLTGTLSSERLPSTLGNASTVYIGNGAGLAGIDASTIQGLEDLSSNSVTANFFFGNGSALSNLSASSITSGVLANAYLPSTIQVDHVIAQDFTGNIEVANLEFLIQSGGTFEANVGNSTQPGYAFDMDTSTGMYRPLASTLGFVSGGVETAQLSQQNGLVVTSNVSAQYFQGNGSLLTGVILSGGETGTSNASNITAGVLATLYGGTGTTSSTGSGNVVLSNDPVLYGNVVVVGNVSSQNFTGNVDLGDLDLIFDSGSYFEANVGNVVQPSYAFDSETSTGIYRPLASTLGFVANGTELARLSQSNGLVVNGTVTASSFAGNLDLGNLVLEIQDGGLFRANLGTNLQPSYAFVGETTTGLYRPAESTIGFVAGGVEKAQVSATGILVSGNVQAQYYTGNGSQLTGISTSTPLTISNVQITDSEFTVIDDLHVSTTAGGYICMNGSGVFGGVVVQIGGTMALSTTVVLLTATTVKICARVPPKPTGTYDIVVVRPDGQSATLPQALTYSPSPIWSTPEYLGNVLTSRQFSTTLAASSDSNVSYANVTVLPQSTTLASNGTLIGNIVVNTDTLFAFDVRATDGELQDLVRTFSLNCMAWKAAETTLVVPQVNGTSLRGYGFGASMAISADATRLVVGSTASPDNNTGRAVVYVKSGTLWVLEALIVSSEPTNTDYFGVSVSISSDGSRIIVGASYKDSYRGAAYVFSRSGTTWSQEAKLVASDGVGSDYFGASVSMTSDGSRVIVGAYYKDSGRGAAYVFSRSGTTWSQETKLVASDGLSSDYFGYSVSISSDSTRVIVGAHNNDVSSVANAGSAYIFSRSGTTWTQETKLIAPDGTTNNYFGLSVSMTSDSTRVIVAAHNNDSGKGAAYVFSRSGTTWTQEAKLVASDGGLNDYFGQSVSISSTGSRVVIGAPSDDVLDPNSFYVDRGSVYLFARTGTTWVQIAKILASDGVQNNYFGTVVSMAADGTRFVAGGSSTSSGAYVIESQEPNASGFLV